MMVIFLKALIIDLRIHSNSVTYNKSEIIQVLHILDILRIQVIQQNELYKLKFQKSSDQYVLQIIYLWLH